MVSRGGPHSLNGQLLFVELEARSIVLDFLLAHDGEDGPSSPVTVQAVWPESAPASDVASVLTEWATVEATVAVTVEERAGGPSIAIESDSTRVILVADA